MCLGYTTPMPKMVALIAKRSFNIDRRLEGGVHRLRRRPLPRRLASIFDRIHRDHVRKGSRVIPAKEAAPTTSPITRTSSPLDLPRELPPDRLLAALEAAPGIGGMLKAKGRAKGLRFVASDLDWSWGDGPEVKGNGEAILLAFGGRPSVLDELGGEGLPALRERLAA